MCSCRWIFLHIHMYSVTVNIKHTWYSIALHSIVTEIMRMEQLCVRWYFIRTLYHHVCGLWAIINSTIKPSYCNEQDYQGSKILLLPFHNYGQKCPWGFDILWKKCWIYFLPRKTQKPLARVAFFAQLPSCWAKINQYIKVTIPFILNIPPHRSSCRGEEPIKNIGGRMGQETVRISRLSAGCWLLENITPITVGWCWDWGWGGDCVVLILIWPLHATSHPDPNWNVYSS